MPSMGTEDLEQLRSAVHDALLAGGRVLLSNPDSFYSALADSLTLRSPALMALRDPLKNDGMSLLAPLAEAATEADLVTAERIVTDRLTRVTDLQEVDAWALAMALADGVADWLGIGEVSGVAGGTVPITPTFNMGQNSTPGTGFVSTGNTTQTGKTTQTRKVVQPDEVTPPPKPDPIPLFLLLPVTLAAIAITAIVVVGALKMHPSESSSTEEASDSQAVEVVQPDIYTVSFETNGGKRVESQEVSEGDYAFTPEEPTRSGYSFEGWYTSPDYYEKVTFPFQPTKDVIIYAKWKKDKETTTQETTQTQGTTQTQ